MLACDLADESEDPTLRAQTLGVEGILYSPVPSGGLHGDVRRSVSIKRQAVDTAPRSDALTRAWLQWWLATELAADGDHKGFAAAVEEAERLSSRSGGTGDGRGFLGRHSYAAEPAKQADQSIALGYTLLGRTDDGVDEVLLRTIQPSRPRVTTARLCDMGLLWTRRGEPQPACDSLLTALELAERSGYRTGMQRARGVRVRMADTWADLECVRGLDERLAAA